MTVFLETKNGWALEVAPGVLFKGEVWNTDVGEWFGMTGEFGKSGARQRFTGPNAEKLAKAWLESQYAKRNAYDEFVEYD